MPTPEASSDILIVDLSGTPTLDGLIVGGERWANSVITYSFPTSGSVWSTDPLTGYGAIIFAAEPWNLAYSPITSSDQTYFIEALKQWENVADIQFEVVTESAENVGDLRVAYTHTNDFFAQAWTYFEPYPAAVNGDIWIESESTSAIEEWEPGTFSFLTIMHEIGHALGLEHPFESPEFPVSQDTISKTIMSYSAIAGNQDSFFTFDPTTVMPLDIAAIQYLYGKNMTYHSGDDSYHFDDDQIYHETIWDSGGRNDAIVYQGQQDISVNLQQGEGSYIGNAVFATDLTTEIIVPNVWIAFDTVIENAQGGSGNDTLKGNSSNNILSGGTGIDTVVFSKSFDHYSLDKRQDGFVILDEIGADGQDTVVNIERLNFSDINVALDLDGGAGQVTKLLGVVFGNDAVNNEQFVGIGLSLVDGGMSNEQLASTALGAVGASSHDEIVSLLWRNLFGVEASEDEKNLFISMLDSGNVSVASLTLQAADTPFNLDNINFVGLVQTGVEFI